MELQKDSTQLPGRWVLAPKKGTRFVGPRERARLRARERRRRVIVVLLESIGITALIGVFPPLRAMLVVTGLLVLLLAAYLALVATMVSRDRHATARTIPSNGARRVVVLEDAVSDPGLRADQERLARVVNR